MFFLFFFRIFLTNNLTLNSKINPNINPNINHNINPNYYLELIRSIRKLLGYSISKREYYKFKGKEKFPCFPNWPKNKEHIAEYVALFPNVMLGIHKDHFYAYWLEPKSNDLTLEHMEIYYVGEKASNSLEFKSLRKQNHKLWEDIQKEDVGIIQRMQLGRNSHAYNGGNFSPDMDNPTHQFHKWVATHIV